MKVGFASVFLAATIFALTGFGQTKVAIEKEWNWIVPLKTTRSEIEKAFGSSITADKNEPYQTYTASFGKVNVQYAEKNRFIEECSCTVGPGTVISTFVSLKSLKLSDLNLNLEEFIKDATFSPREISYFSEKEGMLVATEIVEMPDKTMLERVFAIEYRFKPQAKKP